jgi:hypothetical protein
MTMAADTWRVTARNHLRFARREINADQRIATDGSQEERRFDPQEQRQDRRHAGPDEARVRLTVLQ